MQSLILPALWASVAGAQDWSQVDQVLLDGIANKVYPGCVAAVVDAAGDLVYSKAFGTFVYDSDPAPPFSGGANPPADFDTTLWDMASNSKIMGPTTAAAVLYQWGALELGSLVVDTLGPAFAAGGKANVTVRWCRRADGD